MLKQLFGFSVDEPAVEDVRDLLAQLVRAGVLLCQFLQFDFSFGESFVERGMRLATLFLGGGNRDRAAQSDLRDGGN